MRRCPASLGPEILDSISCRGLTIVTLNQLGVNLIILSLKPRAFSANMGCWLSERFSPELKLSVGARASFSLV